MNEEIEKVEELGKEIGFGWLMSLASALWRRQLKKEGKPESKAKIPKESYFASEDDRDNMASIDTIVDDHLNK